MNVKNFLGSIIVFMFFILSYQPIALEIDDNYTNATLTNNIWGLLDATFGIFWLGIAAIVLFVGLWYAFFEK